MSHTLAPASAPTAGPSTAPSFSTPQTELPSDPRSLAKYLRSAQLNSLQQTYYKSVTTDTDLFAYVRWSKSTGPEAAERRGRAEVASHRQLPAQANQAQPTNPTTADDSARPPKRIKLGGSNEQTKVDSAHAYSLRPAPDMTRSADAYYHGPHPPPPAYAVKSVLEAATAPGMFDPEGVRVSALLAAASEAYGRSQGGVPGTVLPGALPAGGAATAEAAREREEQEEDWERSIVAALSTACAAKIAQGKDKLPLAKRLPPPSITHPQPVGQPALAAVPAGPTPAGPPPHPQHPPAQLGGQHASVGLSHHPSHAHALPPQQQQQQGPPAGAGGYADAYGSGYWRGGYGER